MIDKHILEAYLKGKGTPREEKIIAGWFGNLGQEQELRRASEKYWEILADSAELSSDKARGILHELHHRIRLEESESVAGKSHRNRYLRILSKAAAVLFIPLLATTLWLLRPGFMPEPQVARSEIVCPPGTRTIFHLPDGSQGWLNGGSSISFPVQFTRKQRDVTLKGEAYFQVQSSEKLPFIVSTGDLQVKASGTEFNVKAYAEDRYTEVTLVEGKVDLLKKTEGLPSRITSLQVGQSCLVDFNHGDCQLRKADVEKNISWKDGKLIFRDDPLSEVVRKSNRWFNSNIEIVDVELTEFTYIGTLKDETLDEFLRLIALTAPIEYLDLGRKKRADGSFEKRHIVLKLK